MLHCACWVLFLSILEGCPRPVNVPTIKHPKGIYNIGETIDSAHFSCPPNHVLMPLNGMSCSTGGWTETAECKPSKINLKSF